MSELFRRIKMHMLLSAVLTLLLGMILTVSPGMAAATLLRIIGWVLVIAGVVSLLSAMMSRGKPVGQGDLVLGLLQVASGLILLAKPNLLVSLFGVVLGLVLVLHGVKDIQSAREAKALGYNWKLTLAVGLVKLVMAAAVILAPFSTAALVVRVAGICLIVDALADLLVLWRGR